MATAPRACAPASRPAHRPDFAASGSGYRRRLLGALTVAAVSAGAAGYGGVAAAAPRHRQPTAAEVAAKVRTLQHQSDDLVEDYDRATVALDAVSRRATAARTAADAARRQADEVRRPLNTLAAAAYRSAGAGAGTLATLLGSDDPQHLLDRATSLSAVAHDRQVRIDAYRRARAGLLRAQQAALAEVRIQRQLQQALTARRRQVEGALVQEQQLLNRLSPSLQHSLLAPAGRPVPLASIDATGRAVAVVRFAYAQLGKPYRWGAAGPAAFDCSGLTMGAWHAAGVSLPHSAREQYRTRRHVPTGQLRPGDLVFFGSPIHHVGLYIGAGNMIAAPHTGDVVKIQPAMRTGFVGAARPG